MRTKIKTTILKLFMPAALLIMPIGINAQITVGSDIPPNEGALLDLKQFTTADPLSDGRITAFKGFNLPRVALQNTSHLEPCAISNPINKNSHMGLVVYNTTSNNSLTPGIYYWNGIIWIRLVTEVPVTQVNIRNLIERADFPAGNHAARMAATELNFGEIRIPEDGSYAFMIRIFGDIQSPEIATLPFPYKQPLYLFIMKNGILVDAQELQENVLSKGHMYGITGVLTAPSCNANDQITIRISKTPGRASVVSANIYSGTGIGGAKTSIIFWKI